MPAPLKKDELAERRAQLTLLPKIGRPYRGRPALTAPASRTKLIALAATVLMHLAAGTVLWNMANQVAIIEPPKPLEVSLLSPPPETLAIPEPPPPEIVPPPPPPEPELPPPPEPEPPPPQPPEPEPLPVETPEPPPPPKPKPVKKPVVKPAEPVKQAVEPVKETPPLPPVVVAAPPVPVEQPVVAPLFDAAYLNNPAPPYPRSARKLGLEGTVILRVLVSPDGKPAQVRVETSSGTQTLDEAALNAVRKWSFVPARQGERSVTASVDVPIRFNLN